MEKVKDQTVGVLLTEDGVAALLQVKKFTLRKWRRDGGGPTFVRCGERLIRYASADVHAWLEANRFGSTAHELESTQIPAKKNCHGPATYGSEG